MGLDMYAYFVEKENVISDGECRLEYGQDEGFYWRNDYNLHNWMEKLWERRTGNTDRSVLTGDLVYIESKTGALVIPKGLGWLNKNELTKDVMDFEVEYSCG